MSQVDLSIRYNVWLVKASNFNMLITQKCKSIKQMFCFHFIFITIMLLHLIAGFLKYPNFNRKGLCKSKKEKYTR